MKDTITVRKEHYKAIKAEFKSFGITHRIEGIIGEDIETYDLAIECATLQQFYSAVMLAGMAYAFDKGEAYLKEALHPKPFSESELTQLP